GPHTGGLRLPVRHEGSRNARAGNRSTPGVLEAGGREDPDGLLPARNGQLIRQVCGLRAACEGVARSRTSTMAIGRTSGRELAHSARLELDLQVVRYRL